MAAELQSKRELILGWMEHLLDDSSGVPTFREKPIDLKTFLILIIKPNSNLFLRPEQVKKLEDYIDPEKKLDDWEISEACDVWGVFSALSPIIREMSWGNKIKTLGHHRCSPLSERQITNPTLSSLTPAQIKHIIWVLEQRDWAEIRYIKRKSDSGSSIASFETDISAKESDEDVPPDSR